MTEPVTGAAPMFAVSAQAYDRLMGRYLPTLAPALADAAGVGSGRRALDVGCGPGGLTHELAARLGPGAVAAVDPSVSFVEACQARNPGVDVRSGVAEDLPFDDDSFDVTLASLVVPFLADAAAGIAEMRRVTRPGGTVALCMWDYEHMPTIRTFWAAVRSIDPGEPGEQVRLGMRSGELVALLEDAGLAGVRESSLATWSEYEDFADWWSPFPAGVGPSGAYCRSLSEERREQVRAACAAQLDHPAGPFTLRARAWCAVGTA